MKNLKAPSVNRTMSFIENVESRKNADGIKLNKRSKTINAEANDLDSLARKIEKELEVFS